MSDINTIQSLVELGFTGLEAEIYAFLLEESPVTGYRVAQALGKPAANTYKALETLQAKGAVLTEDSGSRLCRAVPADELLGRLERTFTERRTRAQRALAAIQGSPSDDRVYQIRSRDQVLARCRSMLERAREVAFLDLFPEPLEELRPDVERAVARGVSVAIKVYRPARVDGAEVLLEPEAQTVLDRWPGQWLNAVVDASEHLMAFLSEDGQSVHQAVWSSSPYLSWLYHCGVSSELVLTALRRRAEDDPAAEALRAAITEYHRLTAGEAPGYQSLLRRFELIPKAIAERRRPSREPRTSRSSGGGPT